jgi:hypothetical protein
VAGLTVEDFFAITLHSSQTTPNFFNFSKKFSGVSLSEKLLKGSQVFEDGG